MDNFRDFIFNKCVDFSIRITKLFTYLTQEKHEFVISKQILRSGTSIGANLAEAQYGISRKEFQMLYFSKGDSRNNVLACCSPSGRTSK